MLKVIDLREKKGLHIKELTLSSQDIVLTSIC
jgi:hypothetical protein